MIKEDIRYPCAKRCMKRGGCEAIGCVEETKDVQRSWDEIGLILMEYIIILLLWYTRPNREHRV